MSGGSSRRYPPELRERAVRAILQLRVSCNSTRTALYSPMPKFQRLEIKPDYASSHPNVGSDIADYFK